MKSAFIFTIIEREKEKEIERERARERERFYETEGDRICKCVLLAGLVGDAGFT